MSKKETIRSYFTLLRDRYLQEVLVIPSTILVIIIDAVNRNSFGWLDGIAVFLLTAYLLYVLYDTQNSVVAITINLESSYSLCLGKSEIEYADSLRKQKDILQQKKINLTKVFSHYRIIDFDWQFHENSLTLPTEWVVNIQHINEHFFRYALRIPTKTKLHLFLITPCPIAIGLGYTIGKYRPWIVYQYDSSTYNQIGPVTLNSENRERYKHINIVDNRANQGSVVVNISLISKPSTQLPSISEHVVEITAKKSRFSVSDFAPIASEIIDYLNNLLGQGKIIHLFPGLPIAMGFLIGKELNDQANLQIYNLNRANDNWECVVNLHELSA